VFSPDRFCFLAEAFMHTIIRKSDVGLRGSGRILACPAIEKKLRSSVGTVDLSRDADLVKSPVGRRAGVAIRKRLDTCLAGVCAALTAAVGSLIY
jgi:hypothetical protein